MQRTFYRYPDLVEAGIVNNRTTLARWIKAKLFPAPVSLGPNTRAWPADEVEEWQRERREKRQGVQ